MFGRSSESRWTPDPDRRPARRARRLVGPVVATARRPAENPRVTVLFLSITLGVLAGAALSRPWRRQRVAGRLNALIAADPPATEFEEQRARIVLYRRGLAIAATLAGALAGAVAYGAVLGVLWLIGRA